MAFRKRRVEDMATATKNKSSFLSQLDNELATFDPPCWLYQDFIQLVQPQPLTGTLNGVAGCEKKNLICLPFSVTLHYHSLHFFVEVPLLFQKVSVCFL